MEVSTIAITVTDADAVAKNMSPKDISEVNNVDVDDVDLVEIDRKAQQMRNDIKDKLEKNPLTRKTDSKKKRGTLSTGNKRTERKMKKLY